MAFPWLIDQQSESTLVSLRKLLEANKQSFAAFVGAGVSKQAGLPLWPELLEEMAAIIEQEGGNNQGLSAVLRNPDLLWRAEVLRDQLTELAMYDNFLRKRFSAPLQKGQDVFRTLVSLNFRHFLTTNYDTFLEQSLRELNAPIHEFDWKNRQECRHFLLRYLTPQFPKSVIHIHGRADQPSTIVLSHSSYVQQYVQTSEYVEKLTVLFATLRIVFIGFSLNDPDLVFILRQVNSRFGTGDVQHFAILGLNRSDECQAEIERDRLSCQFGIEPIFYDTANGHAALRDVFAELGGPRERPSVNRPLTLPSSPQIPSFGSFAPPPVAPAPAANPPNDPAESPLMAPAVATWNSDPHKGKFGGAAEDRGRTRRLRVEYVKEKSPGLHAIQLIVESLKAPSLSGRVTFYLHPTFPRSVMEVVASEGRAIIPVDAYGAFTAGVECDNGATRLELDLAEESALPESFRAL